MPNIATISSGDPLALRIKKRVVAVAAESAEAYLTAIYGETKSVDGIPYGVHWQESAFPYFTARLGPANYDFRAEAGTHNANSVQQIVLRAIVAHMTDGYRGEGEALLDELMEPIRLGFMCNPLGMMLRSNTFPDEPNWTDPVTGKTEYYMSNAGAIISRFSGLNAFSNAGTPGVQIGGEWNIEVTLTLNIGGYE